jgi:oxygen-independent coproporphyrinogen-3 oxidase
MMTNNISFYIHIPFCVKKCDYCAFYSLPNQSDEVKQAYFESLYRQISLFPTDRTVITVYFGGGTPPLLGTDRLCKLISLIITRFTLADNCEITVEINPGTVDFEDLKALKKAGVNRLSVGVQSSDDEVLASIGRIHSFAQAKECIENARRAGFDNISADLIFALPYQSFEAFEKSVHDIMSTEVDHISAYSLQVEEGTPIFERRNSLILPDEEGEEKQYEALVDILTENGFTHYEISSFSKNGKRSRHNMTYWNRGEYFGFGAAAHSFYNGRRFSAVADVGEYIEKSKYSLLSPTDYEDSEPISDVEAEEERIMLGLRTDRGASIPEDKHSVAERIAKLGFGKFENGVLALNSKGFRVSNEIISEILV